MQPLIRKPPPRKKAGRSATRQIGPCWQVSLALLFCFCLILMDSELLAGQIHKAAMSNHIFGNWNRSYTTITVQGFQQQIQQF